MARRRTEKPVKTPAAPAPSAKPLPAGKIEAGLAAIERERDELKAALADAEARIKDLDARQADIANRIAWVLDSLHSVLDERK